MKKCFKFIFNITVIINIIGCSFLALTENTKPIANAGLDQTLNLGVIVQLDGSESRDDDGDDLKYNWNITSTPINSNVSLSNNTVINPRFEPDLSGEYIIELIVNDGSVNSDKDQIKITIYENDEFELKLLHTNDHHGRPLSFYDYPAFNQGGLPAQATYVNKQRAENKNILLLGAGDFNTGRAESTFFNAEPDIIGFNYIGYDAVVMGSHEFDNSRSILQEQILQSDFPWLCANVTENEEYLDNVLPYIIKEYDGFKVGIIGLLTTVTEDVIHPDNINGLTFYDEVTIANQLVNELESQVDLIIALVHMGLYDTNEKGSRKLAQEVPGLDLIVDGYTHTILDEPIIENNIPIVQARHWGLYVGNGTIKFRDGDITSFNWQLDPINVQYRTTDNLGNHTYHYVSEEIEEDETLLALLNPYLEEVEIQLGEVIGEATDTFLNDDTRYMETALGNIVTDSQKWFLNERGKSVDFAFQNGGGIRANLEAGGITKKDIYEILTFDNSIFYVSLTGEDVLNIFQMAATKINTGGMPQVSENVNVTFNLSDQTVESLFINEAVVENTKVYNIAVNSFLAAGGDGYEVFNNAIDSIDTAVMQRDVLIDYIISLGGVISPSIENRIVIVDGGY